jgi:hypothetical protein
MKTRIGTLAVLTTVLACAPAQADAATKVKVRVEGATKTIFEGSVRTSAHLVTGDASGPHKCDGTNGGANPTPGPTATGSLDSASKRANFGWIGNWDDSFQDFLVNKIGPDTPSGGKYWNVAVNGKSLQVGGCQYQVGAGDEILWADQEFGDALLRLRGSGRKTRVGKLYRLKVVDTETGKPVAGARVAGRKTNAKGIARLRFKTRGVKRLKAHHAHAVRSNQIRVKVLRRRHRR